MELTGEDLSCYSDVNLNHFGSRKCLRGHYRTDEACLCNIAVTNISESFTGEEFKSFKMTAKNGGHRYETELRHCHAVTVTVT